ncbi:VOC family protein [Arthrobacter pascens]|uniref:VOC family protein n=1 Tax=Arthrobacter pascens TaxID=1677 RepID=UPI00196A5341|nr:VOC family protein [Arthrobacter pascens]MBN3498812.1 VOC family protein [Arthrobacter pascens]MDR6556779.1 catechol 2,3-dioxygenase-like lactoylglutathione lyase family enzyme [Arthrobacter pascens]
MQPRVDFISLGVRSVAASRSFYVEGLGWPVHREFPEVIFIQANHGLILSLWDAGQMQAEAAVDAPTSVPCITLSHNVASAAEVDEVMAQAESAGAAVVASPKTQPWGGYTGYFADPDGFRWEIAFNPTWRVDDGGQVTL